VENHGPKPTEVWKDIPGWEKCYQASSLGRIRSKDKFIISKPKSKRGHIRKGRILTPLVKQGRYLVVTLADGEKRKQLGIHRWVLLTFSGPQKKGQITRHLDGDMYNNRLVNLKYGTAKENALDARDHGRIQSKVPDIVTAQLIKDTAKTGVFKYKDIAEVFGISISHVRGIVSGRVWKETH